MRSTLTALLLLLAVSSTVTAEQIGAEAHATTDGDLLVYSRQAILQSGWLTLGDFLANLPFTGTARGRGTNSSDGAQWVNLNYLSPGRSLVLLNGRRMITGFSGAADLSVIPLSALERVEISLSGQSASLGSGAAAGVINLVTRENQDGLEAGVQFGEFDEGDGRTETANVSYGKNTERGSWYVNFSLLNADPVVASARALSSEPGFGTGTAFGSTVTPQGRFGAAALGSFALTTEPGTVVDGPEDFREGDYRLGVPGEGLDRYNQASEEFVLHDQERRTLFAQGQWTLSEQLSADVDLLLSQRDSVLQFAPPLLLLGLFGTSDTEVVIAADNAFNPFGLTFGSPDGTVSDYLLGRRLSEAGNHRFPTEVDQRRVAGSLNGEFEVGGQAVSWRGEVAVAREDGDDQLPAQIDYVRVGQALAGQPCRDDVFGDGCVELNVFGGQGADGRGTITPQMLDYILFDAVNRRRNGLDQVSLTATTAGPELAAGPVQFDVGLHWRRDTGRFTEDDRRPSLPGEVTSYRNRITTSALSTAARLPLHEVAQLNLAARYVDVKEAGSEFAAQGDLQLSPTPWLGFDLGWSRDFVLPNLAALDLGERFFVIPVADPCAADQLSGCDASGENLLTADSRLANNQLEAEQFEQWHLTARWAADSWGLSGWVRYQELELEDQVTTLNAQSLTNACVFLDRHCQLVGRDAAGAALAPLLASVNDGALALDRVDLGASWADESGRWQITWQAQYVADLQSDQPQYFGQNLTEVAQRDVRQLAGSVGAGVVPRWRSTLDATWQRNRWRATWGVRYVGGVWESCAGSRSFDPCPEPDPNRTDGFPGRSLGSTTYHDLRVGYDWPAYGAQLTLGVQNVLDKDPPLSSRAAGNFYSSEYRTPGRYPYVRVTFQL